MALSKEKQELLEKLRADEDELTPVGPTESTGIPNETKRICCLCDGLLYTSDEWVGVKYFICLTCAIKYLVPEDKIIVTEATRIHANTVLNSNMDSESILKLGRKILKK